MNRFLMAGMSAALITLAACNNNTTPTTEEAAVEAVKIATENLEKFRTCAQENVLTDISSYSSDFGDATLDQAAWFEANGKLDGVTTTESGLQYRVNKSSTLQSNTAVPEQTVRVNYHGLFLNGEKFDSSYDRGQDIEFPLNKVIKGWTEGVGLMRPCDAWTFYIPSDLAYGPSGRGSIPPATPLVFHVQLLGIR
jgi:FKBP-type peptidyl-prolyl cis-trans isomerase FkpA